MDQHVYHVGLLMRDRIADPVANAAGRDAWKRYLDGKVTLVQRRINDFVYEYYAVPVVAKPPRRTHKQWGVE